MPTMKHVFRPLQSVRVRVPATTANLGPGFDALGLALGLYNHVVLTKTDSPGITVAVSGVGEAELPRSRSNIAVQAVERTLGAVQREAQGYRLDLHNAIPLSRGLGSSAAARVGAVFAVNELLGRPLAPEKLLALAVELEGHPDNAAAALFGGLVASSVDDETGQTLAVRLSVEALPRVVVFVPDQEVATEAARRVLPEAIPRADVSFNLGHACVTLAALVEGDDTTLGKAMRDRVHQPYRQQLLPWLPEILQAAEEAGALGAALSGAGSTVLAFVRAAETRVRKAMEETARRCGLSGRSLTLSVDQEGARVVNGQSEPGSSAEDLAPGVVSDR